MAAVTAVLNDPKWLRILVNSGWIVDLKKKKTRFEWSLHGLRKSSSETCGGKQQGMPVHFFQHRPNYLNHSIDGAWFSACALVKPILSKALSTKKSSLASGNCVKLRSHAKVIIKLWGLYECFDTVPLQIGGSLHWQPHRQLDRSQILYLDRRSWQNTKRVLWAETVHFCLAQTPNGGSQSWANIQQFGQAMAMVFSLRSTI